jgi:hypothetical protein
MTSTSSNFRLWRSRPLYWRWFCWIEVPSPRAFPQASRIQYPDLGIEEASSVFGLNLNSGVIAQPVFAQQGEMIYG